MEQQLEADELRQQLSACAPGTLEYASCAHDLAQIKLAQGKVEEASALFQEALQVTVGAVAQGIGAQKGGTLMPESAQRGKEPAHTAALPAPDSEDDWEREAEENLQKHIQALALTSKDEWDGEPIQDRSYDTLTEAVASTPARAPKQSHWTSLADIRHIIELYGLNAKVRTDDLVMFLSKYHVGPVSPTIHWIDDCRALAVFRTADEASSFLKKEATEYQIRRATLELLSSSSFSQDDLAPPGRPRPKTTAAVACKLISHALQRPELRDKEAERVLSEQRQQHKDKRRQRQRAVEEVWEVG